MVDYLACFEYDRQRNILYFHGDKEGFINLKTQVGYLMEWALELHSEHFEMNTISDLSETLQCSDTVLVEFIGFRYYPYTLTDLQAPKPSTDLRLTFEARPGSDGGEAVMVYANSPGINTLHQALIKLETVKHVKLATVSRGGRELSDTVMDAGSCLIEEVHLYLKD